MFRRLRWRLTLYYALAMLATVIIMQITGLVGTWWVSTHGKQVPELVSRIAHQMTIEADLLFATDLPDVTRLDQWLAFTVPLSEGGSGIPGLPMLELSPLGMVDRLPQRYDLAAIMDADGQLLASNVPPSLRGGWQLYPFRDPAAPEVSLSLIRQALAGQPGVVRLPQGAVAAADPIQRQDGTVRGVVYLRMVSTAPGGRLWWTALKLWGTVGALFAVSRVILATLFGFLTAYWLTRRLDRLALVTAAWGRGDFSVQARDPHDDEIGQLARRLNRMAEQLQGLLEVRGHLASLEERNRLARDLHDSVKQQVFATAMQVAAAQARLAQNPTEAAEHLVQAEALARQAQQELNALLRQLRPVTVAEKGLVPALREYVAGWMQQTGISVDLRVRGERRISLDVEQALYRVTQESLANVARHSGTDRLEIELSYQADMVTLQITDHGRGFDVAMETGKGLGLISMRERVTALAGELEVISQPGEGTTVRASLPTETIP